MVRVVGSEGGCTLRETKEHRAQGFVICVSDDVTTD